MTLPLGLNEALDFYCRMGAMLHISLLFLAAALGIALLFQVLSRRDAAWRAGFYLTCICAAVLGTGVLLVCYLHLAVHHSVALKLDSPFASMVNSWIAAMGRSASQSLPLYDSAAPPRFILPPWLGNEKYLFWFFCYSLMAVMACKKTTSRLLRSLLQGLLMVQILILTLAADPFHEPLPRFFSELRQWFLPLAPMERVKAFMQLYPRMIFYYNAHYMWIHPPLLFISYAALTVFFAGCVTMLATGSPSAERLACAFARPGYIALTMGMLLGFPWALQAWGPNWWWDPKISSSIMMWVVFSTYLHARLYLSRRGMWSFVGWLGILCFAAMVFTLATSYLFPGQHTVH